MPSAHPPPRRSAALRWTLALCAVLLFSGFFALGVWQVQRLFWKRDLIASVAQRIAAVAVEAPVAGQWTSLSADNDAYRQVSVSGFFLDQQSARVQAVTELGPGFWLLTPLRRDDGSVVFINRGFIASKVATEATSGRVTIKGLLRLPEPGGGFLHKNDPINDQWYSRDVLALGAARGLQNVAPYFIDAASGQEPASANTIAEGRVPVGGLTVIRFADNHLVYASTWFGLALMVAGAGVWMVRDERRLRQHVYNSGNPSNPSNSL